MEVDSDLSKLFGLYFCMDDDQSYVFDIDDMKLRADLFAVRIFDDKLDDIRLETLLAEIQNAWDFHFVDELCRDAYCIDWNFDEDTRAAFRILIPMLIEFIRRERVIRQERLKSS